MSLISWHLLSQSWLYFIIQSYTIFHIPSQLQFSKSRCILNSLWKTSVKYWQSKKFQSHRAVCLNNNKLRTSAINKLSFIWLDIACKLDIVHYTMSSIYAYCTLHTDMHTEHQTLLFDIMWHNWSFYCPIPTEENSPLAWIILRGRRTVGGLVY